MPISSEITFTVFTFAFPRCEQGFKVLESWLYWDWKWRGPATFGTKENSLCARPCTSRTFFIYLHRLSDSKVLTSRSDWKKSHQLLMLTLWVHVACFDRNLFYLIFEMAAEIALKGVLNVDHHYADIITVIRVHHAIQSIVNSSQIWIKYPEP